MKKLFSVHWFYLIALASVTILVFYPSLFCEITNWDAPDLLTDNLLIRSLSFESIKKIFGNFYWYNYQPLTLFSFALEYHLFKINPFVIHLDNVILHALNSILVYWLLHLITANRKTAFIASLLWVIHPMRVESVTWVVERKDVLYSFFFLLSLICYIKYLKTASSPTHSSGSPITHIPIPRHPDTPTPRHFRFLILSSPFRPFPPSPFYLVSLSHFPVFSFFLSLFFFILACLSKGMAVSLTLILPVLDFYSGRKISKRVILEKIPYLCVSLFFGLLVVFALQSEKAVPVEGAHSLFERLIYSGYGIIFYVIRFFLPLNLSPLYPYYPPGQLPLFFIVFPVLALLLIAAAIITARFTRTIILGFGFYLATFFFVLQYKQTYAGPVADHYSYMGHVGLALLSGWAIEKILLRFTKKLHRIIFFSLLTVLLFLLGWKTRRQISVWNSSITLWEHTLKTNKSPLVLVNLAAAYEEKENNKMALEYYNLAARSLKNYPATNFNVYNNRGNLKKKLSDFSGALTDFRLATESNPGYYLSYLNLGTLMFELEKYDTAITLFNKAIELNPSCHLAWFNKGNAFAKTGKIAPAGNAFNQAIFLNPYEAKYLKARGNLYAVIKQYEYAIQDYDNALALDGSMSEVYFNRANARWMLEDHVGACADWRKASALGFAGAEKMIENYCKD